jgi:hypothetical protein
LISVGLISFCVIKTKERGETLYFLGGIQMKHNNCNKFSSATVLYFLIVL